MAYIDTKRRKKRFIFTNDKNLYEDILRRKKIRNITQYSTLSLSSLRNLNLTNGIKEVTHIWKTGDRYYKLANQYYGRPELWWVIALYNQAPTEGHIRLGDLLSIPTPIDLVLYYL
jgi:nucleoid-associated protein YgaU